MLEELDSATEITKATERLLAAASARGRLPTPVDDLVAAADLVEPQESILSESMLRRAPKHIRDAVAPFRFKIRALLDRKAREIHVAPGIEHPAQRDFKRLHEVVHDILPSQRKLAYADDHKTLSWMTNLRFEQAANQGAAELLFQRELFRQMAADYQIGMAAVVELAEMFGASIHAAFRRYVETHRTPWWESSWIPPRCADSRSPISGEKPSTPGPGPSTSTHPGSGRQSWNRRCSPSSAPPT